jgi:aminopeptidase
VTPQTFDQKLEKYAELAVRTGIGLQAGQKLLVRSPVETAPLARLIVEKAYQAGARLVEVIWTDDAIALARFRFASRGSFDEIPVAQADAILRYAEQKEPVLSIYATDPSLLEKQDPELVAKTQRLMQRYLAPYYKSVVTKEINWTLLSAPIPSWAVKVFPDAKPDVAVDKLWDAIFRICRVDQPDPVAAWKAHVEQLAKRREYLDAKQYAALRFTAPGANLTVGLPQRHRWLGGESRSLAKEIPFIANLPTEEVFSIPHRDRVDGAVTSTKPLSYAGSLIEGLSFRFEKGRVVEARAETNEAALRQLIETDEGAVRLGEVALVPHSSPISQSGLLFYNTLLDENASSHLAIGRAYRPCLEGGGEMSDEAFAAAGGNDSLTHVDFMIGSERMNVDGILQDGSIEPVMRSGEWAD